MPETRIASAEASNLQNVMTDFSVGNKDTDADLDQQETIWDEENWTT